MSRTERQGARDNDRVAELPVVDTGRARSPSPSPQRSLLRAGPAGSDNQAYGHVHAGSRRPGDPVEHLLGSDRNRGGSGEQKGIAMYMYHTCPPSLLPVHTFLLKNWLDSKICGVLLTSVCLSPRIPDLRSRAFATIPSGKMTR